MNKRRHWWTYFTLALLLVVGTLVWCTIAVLRLEHREYDARAQARYHEVVRLALWRMDSMFAPRLARESARPYSQYLAYYPQERAYTRMLTQIEEGAVLNPSPLLTYQSDLICLHFQIVDEELSSPQVPEGNWRDLAESTLVSSEQIASSALHLDQLRQAIAAQTVPAIIAQCEMQFTAGSADERSSLDTAPPRLQQAQSDTYNMKTEQQWTATELTKRAMLNSMNQAELPQTGVVPQQTAQMFFDQTDGPQIELDSNSKSQSPIPIVHSSVTVDPFVPIWLPSDSPDRHPTLVYIRRVVLTDGAMLQGFLVDWSVLRTTLLDEINDLIVDPDLDPVLQDDQTAELSHDETAPFQLATVPAALVGEPVPIGAIPWMTPPRITLIIAWLVVLCAVGGTAIALHSALTYGEKRTNFASAVTHELRTPLTTFQLYSELLGDDNITDPQQRRTYLETLQNESRRLARLVENVLTYARLEDGRDTTTVGPIPVVDLIEHCEDHLTRLAQEAGMTLFIDDSGIDSDDDLCANADRDAVLRILTNLVENSCKYAKNSENPRIVMVVSAHGDVVKLAVRDYGPGVDSDVRNALFQAFERSSSARRQAIPGVGLGLALGRSLAQGMGGQLTLEHPAPPPFGASFVLSLARTNGIAPYQ